MSRAIHTSGDQVVCSLLQVVSFGMSDGTTGHYTCYTLAVTYYPRQSNDKDDCSSWKGHLWLMNLNGSITLELSCPLAVRHKKLFILVVFGFWSHAYLQLSASGRPNIDTLRLLGHFSPRKPC